jgi:hypothetical protein
MTALQVLSALSLLAFTVPVAFAFKFWRERNAALRAVSIEREFTIWWKDIALRDLNKDDYLRDWLSPDDLEQWDWA